MTALKAIHPEETAIGHIKGIMFGRPGAGDSGIYMIHNRTNGMLYIGSAISVKKRFREHRRGLSNNAHHSPRLQNAWNQYGKEAFEFCVLESVPHKSSLLQREQVWLDAFRTYDRMAGYNIASSAGSQLGSKHSAEAKARIQAAMKGRTFSDKTRAKISASKIGRRLSPEHIQKMRERKTSLETRAKISAATIGRKMSDETKEKIRVSSLGKKRSHSTREKMRAANLGKKLSPEHVAKMIAARVGFSHTAEAKAKVRAANLGKKCSAETKAKMSVAAKVVWSKRHTHNEYQVDSK